MNSTIRSSVVCIICISIIIACSNSPTKNDSLNDLNDKQPSLENMVLIPAGEFLMGSREGEGAYDEHPQHRVYLDAYYIDKYEVTNVQFKEFVEATGYVTDAERKGRSEVWNPKEGYFSLYNFKGVNWRSPNAWTLNGRILQYPDKWNYYLMNHPVVQVSWNDARVYCQWVGKRLPTEAEWEKAARGIDGRLWPWGNVFNKDFEGVATHTNIASDYLLPVGSFPTGISPYNVYNMAGNVQEWTNDWYASDYYAFSPQSNPKGAESGTCRVLRGGSWRHQKSNHVLVTNREYQMPDYSSNFVGFRCAWSKSNLK